MASKIAKTKKSEIIAKFAVTCIGKYMCRLPPFDTGMLLRDIKTVVYS